MNYGHLNSAFGPDERPSGAFGQAESDVLKSPNFKAEDEMMRNGPWRFAMGWLLAASVAGACRAQGAGGQAAPSGRIGAAEQRVYIDPATGEFSTPAMAGRGLPDTLRRPDPALSTSSVGLEQVVHPDGSVSVDLQGRFRSRVYATVDEAGNLDWDVTETRAALPALEGIGQIEGRG
jgi:hypothetical protein